MKIVTICLRRAVRIFLNVPVVHPAYKSVPVPNSLCHLCSIPEPVNSFLFAFMRGNRFVTTIFAEL